MNPFDDIGPFDDEYEDDEHWCPRCQGEGQVPTADYESYLGAQMKPCPECHRVTDGIGHGPLS
jgi:DnaJ-class molecular chaperone